MFRIDVKSLYILLCIAIGRYESISVFSFPGLQISFVLDVFQSSGIDLEEIM